mmetsp:Transcript_33745/g.77105  ORF Transcript_33745/g.77105 Transcript_33745/m.77105 type:complete len:237 (+) Transcript_33745:1274-1984(+)
MPRRLSSPYPVLPTLVVGKTKSIVRASSLQLISTMMRWSTAKSSTCSRVNRPNDPPSCMALAPTARLPSGKPSRRSASRPPGATMRRCPRWLSAGFWLIPTRIPFERRRRVNGRVIRSAGVFGVPSVKDPSAHAGGCSSTALASSSSVTSVCGTTTSSTGSTSALHARAIAAQRRSSVSSDGASPSALLGVQATATTVPSDPASPSFRPVMCAQSSDAAELTSSRVSVLSAASVMA